MRSGAKSVSAHWLLGMLNLKFPRVVYKYLVSLSYIIRLYIQISSAIEYRLITFCNK